jgi:cobalt-precorrin 5A hydrolase
VKLAPEDRRTDTRALCVGLGCTRGAPPAAVAVAAEAMLAEAGLAPDQVRLVASALRKQDEPALRLWADQLGARFVCFDDATLAAQNVATRSARVQAATGLQSVAEAAALAAAARPDLLVTRRSTALPGGHYLTLAVAEGA